jgi:hypothetical protein
LLRRSLRALLIVLLVLVPAAPAFAAPPETGRYYVVGPPVNGQPDYLYAIAVATLHNGNRYREIFRLNQGRVQPDGAELTDPAQVLHPGWVLVLPADARGSKVLTGPLPFDRPSSAPVAAPPPPGPVTTRPAADGQPLLTYGGLTLAVLLVGFAVVVLRRRPSENAPLAVPVATSSVRHGLSGVDSSLEMPAPTLPPPPAPVTDSRSDLVGTPGDGRARGRGDARGDGGSWSAASKLVALPATPAGPLNLREELICGGDRATLCLLGARGPNAYIWLSPGMQPPGGRPGVVLGRGDRGRFWLDLAAAPDVLTVTGDPAAGLRLARALIDQLYADGTPFSVVGNALEESGVESSSAQVLIGAGVPAHELPSLLARVRASAGRLLPILIGDVPSARWSLSFPEKA